ncbi:MAG: DNA alkylation repair protein [Zetaproteobacteria bacterium CG_4_9_14_3_um_filter_53_7]|nr:MAG: DNA alkylation repair protein [Zetaproteobacteria bacterium CG_4_9_14_3_um_filter_53_7]
MPEPLKNLYTEALIDELGKVIAEHYPAFNQPAFKQKVFDNQWQAKELKARMTHIAESLHPFLPDSYPQSLQILKTASEQFSGFEPMFFPAFAELYGMDDFEASIDALEHMTRFSSSELAVRPFITHYGNRMMVQMQRWAESENDHVRRLASEGCRPRLPWAMALPEFKRDPSAVLLVLNKLMHDESEYVRRSVANNLNDISKDHPDIVIGMLKSRLGEHPHTDRILKHASRTLLKQGHPEVLKLFGFQNPEHVEITNLHVKESVALGNQLPFSFQLQTADNHLGQLRIEYGIDFMKANGKQARKIFKVSEAWYSESSKAVLKSHSFRFISTRKYYPGRHDLAVIVNGKQVASVPFELTL